VSAGLLVTGVEVDGERVDVRCGDGVVAEVGPGLVARPGETVVRGAAVALPGLHDHHLHLMAMAAADISVDVGPDAAPDRDGLRQVLRAATAGLARGAWLRAVGYRAPPGAWVDRWDLDAMVADRPVRVQHRAGHLWILNSAACDVLGLDDEPSGAVERDGDGRPTGRLIDGDHLLAARLPRGDPPDLAGVSRRLASYGVTGVTDATPTVTAADLEVLARACREGALVQRVRVMGTVEAAGPGIPAGLEAGPVKVMVSDGPDPDPDGLARRIDAAHRAGRPVALHCASRVAAVLALVAWDAVGPAPGDRMEHGAVLPDDLAERLATLGVTVVTQPAFLVDRGDAYLDEVAPDDLDCLYRCAGLERAGVALGGGTDAPFGPEDPWVAVGAAVRRRTRSGRVIGPAERLAPRRALALFLADAGSPGGPVRTVRPGAPADLCLLDGDPLRDPGGPQAARVVAAVAGGRLVHEV